MQPSMVYFARQTLIDSHEVGRGRCFDRSGEGLLDVLPACRRIVSRLIFVREGGADDYSVSTVRPGHASGGGAQLFISDARQREREEGEDPPVAARLHARLHAAAARWGADGGRRPA